MRLADFILQNIEPCLVEWEAFARTIWPGEAIDPVTLRDHAAQLLRATAVDMKSYQSAAEQSEKSKGLEHAEYKRGGVDAVAVTHAVDRAGSGFDLPAVISEYRALRASVLRLWRESAPNPHLLDLDDVTRFNESIDQSMTEAIRGFTANASVIASRLASIVEFSEDAIVTKGLDGIITSWNRAAERIFGYSALEAVGKHITLIVPREKRLEEEDVLSRLRRGEVVDHFQTERCTKDGRLLDISVTISPVRDSAGRVIGASKVARDITAQKHSEVLLRQAEDRFRTLADHMSQFAWSADAAGSITWYNKRWYDYTGLTPDDLLGWGWKKVVNPDHLDLVSAKWMHHLREQSEYEDTIPLLGKDGNYRWFLTRASPIRDAAGNVMRWFGTNTDVTELRATEEALRVARAEAEDANRAKDIFLATLSHELRTPLNAIVGWMSILRSEGCNKADYEEGLDVIERNTKAQVQLIEDVLDVSRIISGKLRLEMRPCKLADSIQAGADSVRPAAEAKDIRLSLKLDPAAQLITCDSTRMQQVIWNLLSNAIKFTPAGGTVSVTLTSEQAKVRIEINDTGHGITPELLPYIFDRFRQADGSTRRKFGGLGLGLSIVKHLIEMHGGTVEAQSAGEGHGSTFIVELPAKSTQGHEGNADNSSSSRGHTAADAPPPVRLDGLRLLVVDDEVDSRRMLSKVLESVGAMVTALGTASAALNVLGMAGKSSCVVDVLVSDLGMPEQDGYDLIREVRRRGFRAQDLPAVALTGFAHKDDAREAVLAGFQVHIPKPVDLHDLTAVIASLAGRTG